MSDTVSKSTSAPVRSVTGVYAPDVIRKQVAKDAPKIESVVS